MSDTTAHLKTSGMHCRSCSMMVDMTLSEMDGVSDARTELATGDTVVVYDDALVSVESIITAIRGAGYDAEVATL